MATPNPDGSPALIAVGGCPARDRPHELPTDVQPRTTRPSVAPSSGGVVRHAPEGCDRNSDVVTAVAPRHRHFPTRPPPPTRTHPAPTPRRGEGPAHLARPGSTLVAMQKSSQDVTTQQRRGRRASAAAGASVRRG